MTLSQSNAANATYDYGRFMEAVLVYFSLNQPRKALLYISLISCFYVVKIALFDLKEWTGCFHTWGFLLQGNSLSWGNFTSANTITKMQWKKAKWNQTQYMRCVTEKAANCRNQRNNLKFLLFLWLFLPPHLWQPPCCQLHLLTTLAKNKEIAS